MDSNASDFCSFGCGGEPDNFVPEPTMEGGWLRGDIRFRSPMMQLHQEIVEFCDFLSPTANEEASRNLAIKRVSGVVKRLWPNSKVEVFGSFKTGLYLPSSDIDAVILGSGVISLAAGLYDLSRSLSKEDIAKELKVIANARVPIIKFVEKTSGISFDISFDVENGPNAVSFVKEAILKWPPLRPLCLILKVFLKQRGLNEVYSGGIGSYALLVMLIAMLQDLRDQLAFPEHNLGVLLIQFFYFYGRELNELEFGVCCGVRGTFSKRSKGFLIYNQPHLLSIEDPQAPENDIGKNSFNYFKIKLAFERAYSAMTNRMIIFGPKRSILDTIIEADAILLERKRAHDVDSSSSSLKHGPRELLQSYYGHNKKITWNCQLIDEGDALARGERTFDNGSSIIRKKRKRFSEAESNNEKKLKENYSWK